MEKAIRELIEELSFRDDEMPHFPKEGYLPLMLSKENFHEIKTVESSKKIAFIDGGNQEIFGAHNFSLQFVRAYYCIYQNNKRIEKGTYEAYILIKAKKKEKSLFFEASTFSKDKTLKINNLSFDAYDPTLSTGNRMVKVEAIGDCARKFLEISLAKKLCQNMPYGFIVLDTTLEATVNGENKLLDDLYEEAKKTNVTIAGLSKTTNLLTESGNSVIGALNSIAPKKEWYYHPIVKINSPLHKAELILIKLHPKSKYIFRLEVHTGNNNGAIPEEFFSLLFDNSRDPVFLGYPYGLIDADKFARVSNREIEVKRTQIFVKMGKDFEGLKSHLNTKNAHNILDNIG